MSLKRRNYIALILLIVASFCWTFGQQMLNGDADNSTIDYTTTVTTTTTTAVTTTVVMNPVTGTTHSDMDRAGENVENNTIVTTTAPVIDSTQADTYNTSEKMSFRTKRLLSSILSFVSVVSAGIAIFVLFQKNPICGPDGLSMMFALSAAIYHLLLSMELRSDIAVLTLIFKIVCAFAVLFSIRELFGWLRARFSVSWCLVHRIVKRCTAPQISLLVFVGWIIASLIGFAYFLNINTGNRHIVICISCFLLSAIFGVCCLWRYGTDLNHFKKQLDNYQKGEPITVGDGAFSVTESQLLDVQAQHEEAVRTAVTSERFKVELISNVSHDLRTPLTSILGYSELLQKETLTSEGQEQLHYLHQKACYMNDLVESLFELTKVSSGVVESKKEQIDLVRLLEQTVGLFDDQLVNAGLTVRRSYESDSVSVITDGARMHQVFANLLGNAIKYALAGTRIYLEVKEKENSYFIRMMNTASYEMDFKPDEIMQRFARGDKARSTKGSGLGLAIAQTYTESVGGIFRVAVDGDQFSAIVELPKTERNL
ncbi:MAG: HAMP domain-containing histidine kinase [Clostridia bacterium]|nr:HAMP domain-containing histidine kinase [Clostridia bacterium]